MPRVTYASIAKAQPDRLEDAIELSRQAAKLTGRHGAEARLLAAELAGEQVGTMVFAIEFENPERYAVLMEEIDNDAEVTELRMGLTRANSPTMILATSLSSEIPLPSAHQHGRGSIVEVHLVKAAPGRLEAAMDEADIAATLLERAGAVGAQAFQMSYAGLQSGMLGLAVEWPSVRAQAQSAAIWATDPAGVKMSMAMLNGTSATTIVSSALYRDIPL
jgi:hypothetical protein